MAHAGTDITLDRKLQFLRRPEVYPDRPRQVEAVETHISWVFLTDAHAYKLKKPARYDFLDFTTVEARRRDAEEEVALNSRLAPNIYEGILPLAVDSAGALSLGGEGEAVDWLVRMRRLPSDRMLDQAIRQGTVETADVRRAAAMLAGFYRASPPVESNGPAYRERFEQNVNANLRELADPAYQLPQRLVRTIVSAQLAFLKEDFPLFDQRVRDGRVIEAHGDLRPEHICLGPEPVVIDCLEFKREFRILDCADELAFLAMECERLGAPAVGQTFFEVYRESTGDNPPERLIHFYESYRAALRAKITAWHLKDCEERNRVKWSGLAMEYLRLAEIHAREFRHPPAPTKEARA
ncbi:MAG: hypothetical protein PHX38_00550 [Sulfuricella sp.]|nr:hypothetical protein [Sulfuricella sp.]